MFLLPGFGVVRAETIEVKKLQCGESFFYDRVWQPLFGRLERQRLSELKSNAVDGIIYFFYSANLTCSVESYQVITAIFTKKRHINPGCNLLCVCEKILIRHRAGKSHAVT